MRKVAAIHELSSGVWLVESPIGLNPGDAGGVLCKSPHALVCAMLRASGVDPATYLASFGALPTPEPKPEPPPNCDGFAQSEPDPRLVAISRVLGNDDDSFVIPGCATGSCGIDD